MCNNCPQGVNVDRTVHIHGVCGVSHCIVHNNTEHITNQSYDNNTINYATNDCSILFKLTIVI